MNEAILQTGTGNAYWGFGASLARRVTQAAALLTLLIVLIGGGATYLLAQSLLQENITQGLEQQVRLDTQHLELTLEEVLRNLSTLAGTTVISNALLDASGRDVYLLPLLRSFTLPTDADFQLSVCDFEGKVVADNGNGQAAGHRGEPWIASVIDDERPFAGLNGPEERPRLLIAHPILFPATGRAEGMLVLEFDLVELLLRASPYHDPALVRRISAFQRVLHDSAADDGRRLFSVTHPLSPPPPLERLGLNLSLAMDREHLDQPLRELTLKIGAAVALLMVLVVAAARHLSRRVTAPLNSLSETALRIAAGGELHSEVSVRGGDEVATLAAAFNAMVVRLHAAHEELEQRVEERTGDLNDARRGAELANQAKSEFLANMSHELRTPMHAILSFAALGIDKVEKAPPEKIRHYLERIHESGSRLLYLLNELLDLSKLEAGMMEFTFQRDDLHEVALIARAELAGVLKEKGVSLQIMEPGSPAVARFDRVRILQVMRNLLDNAIKFSPEGGEVTLSFASALLDGGRRPALAVTVSDHGVGIPAGEIEAVFDKFVQSSKTKSGAGGTGLGLAICKEIVEGHGGSIGVGHNPGGGARFRFVLPIEPAAQPPKTRSDA